MTLPTHIALGLVIGSLSGNYTVAVLASVLPDADHLLSYARHGVLLYPKKLWRTVTDQDDPYKDQRGILHNVLVFLVVASMVCLLGSSIAQPLIMGWLGHLCLDAFDNADYWPLYPSKKISIRGPIKYYSIQEVFLFAALMVSYIFLIYIT